MGEAASPRYAIYYAPPKGHPLKQLADAWLGRDPDGDRRVSLPVVPAITPERLLGSLRRALEKRRLVLENRRLKEQASLKDQVDARLLGG